VDKINALAQNAAFAIARHHANDLLAFSSGDLAFGTWLSK